MKQQYHRKQQDGSPHDCAERNKADRTSGEPRDFTPVWEIKPKATNGTNEPNLINSDSRLVVTRGKGGGGREGSHIDGDGRSLDFGW